MIDLCLKIATEAHRGQKDLDGNPVILHALTVGLMGKNADEQCAGFLQSRERGYTRLVEKHEAAMKEFNLPVMMYIHGFRSGANGSKRGELQEHFENRYRVIAPEVDADPEKSLAFINEMIEREKPEIIVGTSLGGWMTLMCDSGDAQLVVVNPSTEPQHTLSRWVGQELPYFCKRLDGVQTYKLTQEVIDKYADYDIVKNIQEKSGKLHALCSSNDELIGDIHIRTLQPLLPPERLIVTTDFGHRCSGSGMNHLFKLLERISMVKDCRGGC